MNLFDQYSLLLSDHSSRGKPMKEESNIRRLPRRSVLTGTLALGLSAVAAESVFSPTSAAAEPLYTSFGWRFCKRCFALFRFSSSGFSSLCPRMGPHEAEGWVFKLTYNRESSGRGETSRIQANWRQCNKCSTLYWGDEPGRCADRGGIYGHEYAIYGRPYNQFLLPHDRGQPRGTQNQWRFCVQCSVLFYNGFAKKGKCPGYRDGHKAAGYDFSIYVQDYQG
ncbi:hypothetical protein ACSDR0_45310 [Streptosporangium sp. G11]|uniref:hypothetical protein n=1 Tax=Streptosporangium sp. G11 TaxID=3436926 RepID=UPI003EC09AD7